MNDTQKTAVFVAVAAVVVGVALVSHPRPRAPENEDVRNQPLYPEFTDPQSVASLEIVKFDESRGTVHPFRVAQIERKGKIRWSIPSHDDYPADAKDHMAAAGASMLGLKILDKVSDNEGDQREYGVVDPDPKALKLGATGVGDKIVMRDKKGKELLSLIVGKNVPDKPGLRYVRRAGESAIYVVEANTDKLSTKFEDWIEPNLLQINTMDMKDLLIRDYAIRVMGQQLGVLHRGKTDIAYNDAAEPHWSLISDQKFVFDEKKGSGGKWEMIKLAPDQELNAANLDRLKAALDDLKIVDVSRKPAGLSADLKVAADFASNQQAVDSLEERGFFLSPQDNGQIELFSNEGEIRVVLKNGVEYVLRFGQIAGPISGAKDVKKDAKKKGLDDKDTGLNRYLFVMAEFNEKAIPKPQIVPLPEPGKPADAEKKPADDKKSDGKKPEDKKPDAAKKPEPDKKALEAQRAKIEKENKRNQDSYDRQIAAGKKRVAELNARFADWYYIISDEEYRKIHLGRDELITKKPKKPAAKPGEGPDGGPAGHNLPMDLKVPGPSAKDIEKAERAMSGGK